MTFTDLLRRNLHWEWHEAVALVRDVVDRMPEQDAAMSTVPDLHQVELLPSGEVKILGGDSVGNPVERLSQMLQALLTRSEPPVQLRLSLAQPQESAQAWSDSIGFFERPDRPAVLRDLYNRASAALLRPDADTAVPALDAPADPNEGKKREPSSGAPSRRRRRKLALAVALPVLLTAAAGALYAFRAESASPMGGASELVAKGISGVTSVVGSAASAIGDRVGLGAVAAGPAEPLEAAEKPAAARPSASTRKRTPRAAAAGDVAQVQPAARSGLDLSTLLRMAPSSEKAWEVPPVFEETRTVWAESPLENVVFSPSSPGVSPPVGVRPQLPQELPAGVRPGDLTRMELVILPDGTVESVKLLDEPATIHDSMLLSAAKAWQFNPAMKDGRPVSYRHTVRIAR